MWLPFIQLNKLKNTTFALLKVCTLVLLHLMVKQSDSNNPTSISITMNDVFRGSWTRHSALLFILYSFYFWLKRGRISTAGPLKQSPCVSLLHASGQEATCASRPQVMFYFPCADSNVIVPLGSVVVPNCWPITWNHFLGLLPCVHFDSWFSLFFFQFSLRHVLSSCCVLIFVRCYELFQSADTFSYWKPKIRKPENIHYTCGYVSMKGDNRKRL